MVDRGHSEGLPSSLLVVKLTFFWAVTAHQSQLAFLARGEEDRLLGQNHEEQSRYTLD